MIAGMARSSGEFLIALCLAEATGISRYVRCDGKPREAIKLKQFLFYRLYPARNML